MSAENWKTVKLGDICDYVVEKVETSILSNENYISTENMLQNKAGIVSATILPNIRQTLSFSIGDILVSNIRPYFKKIWKAKFLGGCSNDVLVFRAKSGIDKNFFYYVLSSDNFFDYATATAKGTKMPRGDKVSIMKYELKLPPLEIQKKIAGTLSALDDKIELNNKINANLEQQAQALFKSWFVDFEPFGGNAPKDWKVGNLLEIADYLNGLAMQKFRPKKNEKGIPVLKIKELRQGFCDGQSDLCSDNINPEYIIDNGDVIFSWSGTLLVDIWCGGKCGLNQHLFKVSSCKYSKWFYYLWTKHYLEKFIFVASDKATTMGHIKREELKKAKILIPTPKEYETMTKIVEPIIEKIINNRIENKYLSSLRDSLLPKLMNGEIDVSKICVPAE